jgi:hypothetical protein
MKDNFGVSTIIALKMATILNGLELSVGLAIIDCLLEDAFRQLKQQLPASEYEEYKKDFINKLFDAEFIKKWKRNKFTLKEKNYR